MRTTLDQLLSMVTLDVVSLLGAMMSLSINTPVKTLLFGVAHQMVHMNGK